MDERNGESGSFTLVNGPKLLAKGPVRTSSSQDHEVELQVSVKSRYVCLTLASAPVSHSAARPQLLGDIGLGTCVSLIPPL